MQKAKCITQKVATSASWQFTNFQFVFWMPLGFRWLRHQNILCDHITVHSRQMCMISARRWQFGMLVVLFLWAAIIRIRNNSSSIFYLAFTLSSIETEHMSHKICKVLTFTHTRKHRKLEIPSKIIVIQPTRVTRTTLGKNWFDFNSFSLILLPSSMNFIYSFHFSCVRGNVYIQWMCEKIYWCQRFKN